MTNIPIEEIKNAIEAYKKERQETVGWEYFMGRPNNGGKLNQSLSNKQLVEINTLIKWVAGVEDLNELSKRYQSPEYIKSTNSTQIYALFDPEGVLRKSSQNLDEAANYFPKHVFTTKMWSSLFSGTTEKRIRVFKENGWQLCRTSDVTWEVI